MPQVDGEATLPRDLSPWGMFMAADHVVKAVMIGLALASVLSWTVWLAKSLELLGAKRRARTGIRALAQSARCMKAPSACARPEARSRRSRARPKRKSSSRRMHSRRTA